MSNSYLTMPHIVICMLVEGLLLCDFHLIYIERECFKFTLKFNQDPSVINITINQILDSLQKSLWVLWRLTPQKSNLQKLYLHQSI